MQRRVVNNLAVILSFFLLLLSCSEDDNSIDIKPSQPVLDSPTDNAQLSSKSVKFVWAASTHAANEKLEYKLVASRSEDMSSVVFDTTISSTSVTKVFEEETTYYWNVVVSDQSGSKVDSDIRNFSIEVNEQSGSGNEGDGGDGSGGSSAVNPSDYYRTVSTQRPSWKTYGIPSQPTWGFITPDHSSSFYASLEGLKGDALKAKVKQITQVSSSGTDYDWTRFNASDEDPRNTNNVIAIYLGESYPKQFSGTNMKWNREHVFAKSNGDFKSTDSGVGADNHHIRASNVQENGFRASKILGSGYIPREAVRGDVARMSFYAALMYNLTLSRNIDVAWALEQNKLDKVDDWEMQRNNVVEDLQGNRNAFVDLPMLADYIFGDKQNVVFYLPK